jgi:nucleoside-diphosphate-sugar epimerase
VQFVHLDDIASAVDLARRNRLDGAYNVAPDGWISGELARALAGAAPRLRLPARLAARLAEWSWELRLGPIPPGLLPYTEHPWVIANDKLRAEGWVPRHSNEEAYVAGTEGSRWSMLTPKRKQELALGASGAALLLSGAGVAFLARRARRRR